MTLSDHFHLIPENRFVKIYDFDFSILDSGFIDAFFMTESPLLLCPVVFVEDDSFVLSLDYERYLSA